MATEVARQRGWWRSLLAHQKVTAKNRGRWHRLTLSNASPIVDGMPHEGPPPAASEARFPVGPWAWYVLVGVGLCLSGFFPSLMVSWALYSRSRRRLGLLTLEQVLGDHGSTAITSVNRTIVATRTNARASRKIAAVASLSRFTAGLLSLEFERLVREVADRSSHD